MSARPGGAGLAPLDAAVAARLDGEPLAVLLDIDGTLAPIARTPAAATVPPSTRATLRALVSLPNTSVALVSGRAANDAWNLAGVEGVTVIGNHGVEVREANGDIHPDRRALPYLDAVSAAAAELQPLVTEIAGVVLENKTWTLSVHYRMVDPDRAAAVVARVVEAGRARGLRVTQGKKVLELRPPLDINKGTASVAFAERVGALGGQGSVFYAGDDRTDEDAFDALRSRSARAVTVKVAADDDSRTTRAEFVVESTAEMARILEMIVARRREKHGATQG